MIKPNPKNYDFLWLVNNRDYFHTSLWLNHEYLKRDFIITCQGSKWKLYIGRRERYKLSKYGLTFLKKYFFKFKNKVLNKIKEVNNIFRKTYLKNLSLLSNKQLGNDFLSIIKKIKITHIQRLYFFSEYFLYDKVQERIEKNQTEYYQLINKIKGIQKLKFQMRKSLNKTIFGFKGSIIKKYIEEIQKRTGIENFSFFHYQEIVDSLEGKKVKIVNRKNFIIGKFSNWKPIIGEKALKIIKSFDDSVLKITRNKELKGQVANKGIYKGRVKIIPFDLKIDISKEISKMKKGDILVTGSTGPEMILACRKAGAIVTEEGGICSHAAIVSRELDIPCVIGTKVATQVLKDGDLIEVDANKGIVKIL